MQVVRKKASLPDISMGKSTEPLKTRQYVTAETLTADQSIRNCGDAYHRLVNTYRGDACADRSPLDFGDVGHAEIIRDVNFS